MVKRKLNVNFDCLFDGRELFVYLGDHDVTRDLKKVLGEEEFSYLENSFRPKEGPDPMDLAKDKSEQEMPL